MFAQQNVGHVTTAYEKETGEIVVRFERMQLLFPAADWNEIMRLLGYGRTTVQATVPARK